MNIDDALRDKINTGKLELPVLPEVANRVLMLSQNQESNASQLANLIQSDPALAGHVMRIANSAAYSPNGNIISLQQAITRLGMTEISQIAIGISINSKMFNAPHYKSTIEHLWKHALCSALWSKEIARAIRKNVEAAFLCGLLHSIGRPVILQAISDIHPEKLDDKVLNNLWLEFEIDVSMNVIDSWKLPTIVHEAVCYYRNFAQAPTAPDAAATVNLSTEFANYTLSTNYSDHGIKQSLSLDELNLYPEQVQQLLEKNTNVISGLRAFSS